MHALLRRPAPIVLALAVGALVAVTAARAADSITVAGAVAPTGMTLSARTAGENLMFDGSGTHDWSGSLSGTDTIDVHFAVHSLQTVTYQGLITFTGSTPCGNGTIRFAASGSGLFPGPVDGQATTIDQADSTVPMHGTLHTVLYLTPAGAFVTYTGDVRCG
jgi:hypothetical protein